MSRLPENIREIYGLEDAKINRALIELSSQSRRDTKHFSKQKTGSGGGFMEL